LRIEAGRRLIEVRKKTCSDKAVSEQVSKGGRGKTDPFRDWLRDNKIDRMTADRHMKMAQETPEQACVAPRCDAITPAPLSPYSPTRSRLLEALTRRHACTHTHARAMSENGEQRLAVGPGFFRPPAREANIHAGLDRHRFRQQRAYALRDPAAKSLILSSPAA